MTTSARQFSRTLEHDLRSIVEGDCLFDPASLEPYATDACWYRVLPLAVVQPRHAGDVSATLKYCFDREVPVIPRGAATGLAGQAVGMGVILDFTRYMNAIGSVTESTVRVQPGLVLNDLNSTIAPRNAIFPIDPASAAQCTIGGMIGTNAAGAHGVVHGSMKDHVHELTVVLSNGEQAVIRSPQHIDEGTNPFLKSIDHTVSPLLKTNAGLIRDRFPKVQKNSSGYNLNDAVHGGTTDFRKLIVGSEGTLVVVVEAVLGIQEKPTHRLGALAAFKTYEAAVDATIIGLDIGPAAIEIMDKTYVDLVQGLNPPMDKLMADARVAVYFEFEGGVKENLQKALLQLGRGLAPLLPVRFLPLTDETDVNDLWELRREASRVINTVRSSGKTSFIEDVAVPLPQLPAYVRGLKSILEQHRIEFCLYGHAGTGNIHCATFVDLRDLRHYRAIDTIASDVYDLAISLGGTLSGEHGDGFVRTPFLERLYGSEIYGLFRAIKAAFDPKHILNPGKIIGEQNTSILHDLALS